MKRGKHELVAIMEATAKLGKAYKDFEMDMAILDRLYPYEKEEVAKSG